MNAFFAMLNGWEIFAILAVILVLFGAKKLPELARGLGQGIKEFKKSSREIQEELDHAMDLNSPPPPPPRQITASETKVDTGSPSPTATSGTPPPAV